MKLQDIKFDCRNFRGDVPCIPNKKFGCMCECKYYDRVDSRILIIKLGAAGDVIRTTPLLYPLKKEYPNSMIYWLTYAPELVPVTTNPGVDIVLNYNAKNIAFIEKINFDLVVNLDKDKEAIFIADKIDAKEKRGFIMRNGYCYPADGRALHKYLTGIFDNISMENKKSYPQEIFEICGYEFNKEKYLIDIDPKNGIQPDIDYNKTIIGLNTGCGERWVSRLWKNSYWIELIKMLQSENFEVILLGGPSEDENNIFLSKVTGAKYFGYFDIKRFINLVNKCDIIVSQVTMAMHIAIALGKKLVLMNNIFNPNEFELYGNGEIVHPRKKCKCYFQPECINTDYECMDQLYPEDVFNSCIRQMRLSFPYRKNA
jgi:ADP-heptose:LPS heptosyltransferase